MGLHSFILVVSILFIYADSDLDSDNDFLEVEDRMDRPDGRLGRPGKPQHFVKCGRWTNRHIKLGPGESSWIETQKQTERCTVVYEPINNCTAILFSCSKFMLDNRDPGYCRRGDALWTKPDGTQPHVYCRKDGPTPSYPVVAPKGNLKIWYKHTIGLLGIGRYKKSGLYCTAECRYPIVDDGTTVGTTSNTTSTSTTSTTTVDPQG